MRQTGRRTVVNVLAATAAAAAVVTFHGWMPECARIVGGMLGCQQEGGWTGVARWMAAGLLR